MLHFGEVFSAEIYARDTILARRYQRVKEVVKPWVSRGVSFGTFLSLLKEKYEHSRKEKILARECALIGATAKQVLTQE